MTSEDTPIYSLVYSSAASQPFSDDELAELLAKARAFNESQDITGMLLYRAGRFVQFLEGDEKRVRALLDDIIADPRHAGVQVLIDGVSSSRQFGEWTMGYEPISEPTEPLPEGFRDTFEDLENASESHEVLRAAQALSMWFRVRAGAHTDATV